MANGVFVKFDSLDYGPGWVKVYRTQITAAKAIEEQIPPGEDFGHVREQKKFQIFDPAKYNDNADNEPEFGVWTSANFVRFPNYATVEFPTPVTISKMEVREVTHSNWKSRVTGFKIQGSNDKATWTDKYTGTTIGVKASFNLTSEGTYTSWRLGVTSASGPTNFYFKISKWDVMDNYQGR